MTQNKNAKIELRIEPVTTENITQLENIEQVEETDTAENATQVVNDTQEDETDIEIHNLKNKIINLCGKIYNLKHI